MSSCGRGIGVHVQSAWHGGLGFASHHPDNRCRKTNCDKEISVGYCLVKSKWTKASYCGVGNAPLPRLLCIIFKNWMNLNEIDGRRR